MNLDVQLLGTVPYAEALARQFELLKKRQNGEIGDTLLLLEHPAVLTLGRRAPESHILAAKEWLQDQGVSIERINRGGDITYHGPGQLVGYAILNLQERGLSVRDYISGLEQTIIRTLKSEFHLASGRDDINRGVWVGQNKICAIGVAVKRFVTMHGFALNLNTDLDHFNWIVPCGIKSRGVTSVSNETGCPADIKQTATTLAEQFKQIFHYPEMSLTYAEQ